MTRRATVYLEPQLHRAIKIKAAETDVTVSDLVNEALRLLLKEDAIDLRAIDDRQQEPTRSFDSVIDDMKRDGLL